MTDVAVASATTRKNSALGLSANVSAAKGLVKPRAPAPAPEAPVQKPPSPAPPKDATSDLNVGKHAEIPAPPSSTSNVDEFVATAPRKATPTKTPANQYEIEHTGSYNYTISGGGETFDIDGYRGETILEAKHVGKPKESPFVPGSSCPEHVREEIVAQIRDELRRARAIIESDATPFMSLEVITNSEEAKVFFEGLLDEMRVPGTVQLKP
jgi:hypothetical protein